MLTAGNCESVQPAADTRQSWTSLPFRHGRQCEPMIDVSRQVLERVDCNVGFMIDHRLLNPLGEQANLSSPVDRTHVGIATTDQRYQLGGYTRFQQQASDMFGLPEGERALTGCDPKLFHDVEIWKTGGFGQGWCFSKQDCGSGFAVSPGQRTIRSTQNPAFTLCRGRRLGITPVWLWQG